MRFPFWRRRREADLDEEINHHLQMAIRDRQERGQSAEEAETLARYELGNTALVKEATRTMWGLRWIEQLGQDLRYAGRMLVNKPGFSLIVIITLALGIGANTAIFSVVYQLLINPLPFKDASRLVYLSGVNPQGGRIKMTPSPQMISLWHEQGKSFEDIEEFVIAPFALSGVPETESFVGQRISTGMLSFLGLTPIIGRGFEEQDAVQGAEKVVLLSEGLWKRQFNRNPTVLGQTVTLNDLNYRIVGVFPSKFRLRGVDPEVLVPLEGQQPVASFVIARLKRGVTLQSCQAELDFLSTRLLEQQPNSRISKASVTTPAEDLASTIRQSLLVLFAAVGLVLLIACANVASLTLSRNNARNKEITIRTALGAGRGRIMRQLLIESLLLSLLGGAAGIILALFGLRIIIDLTPSALPQLRGISLSSEALLFTLFISIVAGLFFGIIPALKSSKTDLTIALKQGSTSAGALRDRTRFRNALVVIEIALSLILLVGAGLLIRSFIRLQNVDAGFDPDNLVSVLVVLPKNHYQNTPQQLEFYQQLLVQIRKRPDVKSADITNGVPPHTGIGLGELEIEGRTLDPSERPPYLAASNPGQDYFHVMGIPVIQGRAFNSDDDIKSTNSVIINTEMAKHFWPDESAISKRFRLDKKDAWYTVVGVVGNVKVAGLDNNSFNYQIYSPASEANLSSASLIVRASSPSSLTTLMAELRETIRTQDKNVTVKDIQTARAMLGDSLDRQRFNLVLLSIFAGLAIVLAVVGIYGLMSYSVSQSTHEIGIRLALGAQRSGVMKLVIGQGLVLTVLGVFIGTIGALAATRLIESLLYNTKATVPLTFAGVACLLFFVSFVACFLPARRATKVDPMVALRYE